MPASSPSPSLPSPVSPVAIPVIYTAQSTLEELPGVSSVFSGLTTGEELGKLFADRPDLPGVILFEKDKFAGVISQAHFYKCVSRAFGREIYYRRPAQIMLQEMTSQPLVLPAASSVPFAVEQCLARPLDLLYEPFLVFTATTNQYRLCAFQDLLLASSQIAALRSRQMEQILNSVTDGLLVIDKNFRIGGEHSQAVTKIFERPHLRDVSLLEVLHPLIDATTYEQLQDYLKILFDPKLIDRLIKSINPAKQIPASFAVTGASSGKRTKHFAFYFERIRTQMEISQVLVRVEDITQRLNLAKELEAQEAAAEEKLNLVMQILQVDPDQLQRFMTHFNQKLPQMVREIEQSEGEPKNVVHLLFRQAHTLKGEAAVLRLTTHERHLHQLEDQLDKLRTAPNLQIADLATLRPFLETLQKLGDQINQSLEQLKTVHSPARNETTKPASAIQTSGTVALLTRLISDLGTQLNKPAQLHTKVNDDDLPKPHFDLLTEALLHLTRNSMVHGIEDAAKRASRGKSPRATIQLEVKAHSDFHEIIFQDDGGGLSLEKIRNRVNHLGWKLSTEDELRQAIFEPGFSTADKVTELAGRGVGLDIVRSSLQSVGGKIIPHSQEGAYCAFQIILPRNSPPPPSKP